MKIVIAPDSFKGTLSAMEAANCIESGIQMVLPNADITKIPMADGGEGTVDALVDATRGKKISVKVCDPLGREIEAQIGLTGDSSTAIIEMAAASGLMLLKKEERNPLVTTTFGTGQLMKAALDQGVKSIIMGIGGSATSDGGAGMAQALGISLQDSQGNELEHGGAALINLAQIDASKLDSRIATTKFMVACDVDNPLLGPTGAARIYAPQKGATPEMVEILERGLQQFATKIEQSSGKKVADVPGSGAAGGLGAALVAFCDTILKPGIDIIIDALNLEKQIQDADLVITGEGQLDYQTAFGKTPAGVAKIAKKFNIPVIAIAGSIGDKAEQVHKYGIDAYFSALQNIVSEKELQSKAAEILTQCSAQVIRSVLLGQKIKGS